MIWLPLAVLVVELGGLQNDQQHTTHTKIVAVVAAFAFAPIPLAGLRMLLHDFLIGPARAWRIRRATDQPVYYDSRRREFYERRRRTRPSPTDPEEQDRTD